MINEDLNQIRDVVRAEIQQLGEVLRAEIQQLGEVLRAEIAAAEERAQEFARNIETALLTAFHGHAKGQTARFHTTEVANADLAIRMAALEDRVLNLETRRPSK